MRFFSACSTEISFKQVHKQKHRTAIWIGHPIVEEENPVGYYFQSRFVFRGVNLLLKCLLFWLHKFGPKFSRSAVWLFGLGAKATLDTSQSGYTQDHQGRMRGVKGVMRSKDVCRRFALSRPIVVVFCKIVTAKSQSPGFSRASQGWCIRSPCLCTSLDLDFSGQCGICMGTHSTFFPPPVWSPVAANAPRS